MEYDIDDDPYFGGGMPDDYEYDGYEEPEEYEDEEEWLCFTNQTSTAH